MQVSSKLLFRTAIVVLGIILLLGLYLSLTMTNKAQGITLSDWAKLQGYVDSYIQRQYSASGEGEGSVAPAAKGGFYINQAALKSELDSNGDGTILGEGDDLANAPVLVDNLNQLTTAIPGTSFRCNWSSPTAGNNCFEAGAVSDVKTLVDNHEAATGHVPDVVDYCMTDHTAAPTTGGWGYIAQTGGLATDGSVPYVYGMAWGRDGWTNTPVNPKSTTVGGIYTYPVANPVGAAGAQYTYTPPATVPGSCTSASGDAELVRCAAQWAITSTQGNVGNGQFPAGTSPAQTLVAGQIVDIRTGSPANTVLNGAAHANEISINTIFNTGLTNVNPSATGGVLIASASQGPGGIVAEGLRMLGYATALGGYIHSGVPYWNNTMSVNQGQPNTGVSYPLQTVTAWSAYGDTDTVAPTISSPSAAATGPTTATVSRTTSEPATSKIDLSGSDGSSVHTNSTILHASNTTSLSGLNPGVTYTGTLTVYDAQAMSSSTPVSFTTPACGKPVLTLGAPNAYWASYTDYTNRLLSVDWTISNTGAASASNVQITGSTNNNGVTVATALPTTGINIAAGTSALVTLKYNVPSGTGSWHTSTTASATDLCGATYTYP